MDKAIEKIAYWFYEWELCEHPAPPQGYVFSEWKAIAKDAIKFMEQLGYRLEDKPSTAREAVEKKIHKIFEDASPSSGCHYLPCEDGVTCLECAEKRIIALSLIEPKVLTLEELIHLNEQWEIEYEDVEMTDAEWEYKRWQLISQATIDKGE